MTKFGRRISSILLILAFIISIIPQVKANPVIVSFFGPFMFLKLVFLFFITFTVESSIIRIFLGSNIARESSRKFYKSVFAVNLLTFPLTQLFGFVFYLSNLSNFNTILFISIIVEIFPIMLECLLYLKIFRKYYFFEYDFEYGAMSKTIIKSTITANLITFMIGFPMFLFYY